MVSTETTPLLQRSVSISRDEAPCSSNRSSVDDGARGLRGPRSHRWNRHLNLRRQSLAGTQVETNRLSGFSSFVFLSNLITGESLDITESLDIMESLDVLGSLTCCAQLLSYRGALNTPRFLSSPGPGMLAFPAAYQVRRITPIWAQLLGPLSERVSHTIFQLLQQGGWLTGIVFTGFFTFITGICSGYLVYAWRKYQVRLPWSSQKGANVRDI